MANYFFPGSYPGMIQQPMMQAQPLSDMKRVSGEAEARAYLIAPNATVTLWDANAQTVYIKTANAAGQISMRIADYTFREDPAQASTGSQESAFATKDDISLIHDEIEALRAKFEGMEAKKK